MLSTARSRIARDVREEHGFTLIEVLVAMISGVIVLGALVLILEVTVNQTARIQETSQANQLGRITMTKILDSLQSACMAHEFTPINEKSTEQKLRFAAAYTQSSAIKYSEAAEHEIVFKGETLTEMLYPGISGEEPAKFGYSLSSTRTTQLGANIAPGTNVPVFRYYSYAKSASGGTETPEAALALIKPSSETSELKATAKEVAAVVITFRAGVPREELLSSEKKAKSSVPSELRGQVTFAFAAPASEASVSDSPCR
ncbi:MAG: PilW family protein [Solirubrobacteraceae bacterium]